MTQRSSWLHRDASVADAFERRAARAALLVDGSSNPDVLEFAAGLYRAQAFYKGLRTATKRVRAT